MSGTAEGEDAAGGAGAPDAVLLAPLSEDTFLHNLHVRYKQDLIYTYVGNALISVNPCRPLPLYSAELVRAYLARPPYTLPPHIYAITATAYRWVRDRNEYQCIVMTGESGSGKTEAARVCLQCCALAGGGGGVGVGGALTAAGTLLEAFGNAATARNHNASRYGKLLDVEFDFKGEPVGGHITHFLLEKGRAHGAGVGGGERNFHVLYQLLAGADVQLLKRLKLQRAWESYRVLAGSARDARGAVPAHAPQQDRDHFAFTKAAMVALGFGSLERGGILRVLAFLLKLGNVTFEPQHNIDGTLGARLQNPHELEEACSVVGVCSGALSAALGCAPPPAAPHVPHVPHLTPGNDLSLEEEESDLQEEEEEEEEEPESGSEWDGSEGSSRTWEGGVLGCVGWARARRDRLLAALYARLFTWLVANVNARLQGPGGGAQLGILDVYGLEALAHNGLERLLINYAAERVQAAVRRAAQRDQDEYARERLPYTPLLLRDRGHAADLLDQGPESVLACIGGAVDGARLIQRLQRRRHTAIHVLPPMHFRVMHFGGAVVYCARGMPAKNRDGVCARAQAVLSRAHEPLMRALFPAPGTAVGTSPRRGSTAGGLAARQRALLHALLRRLPPQPRLVRCLRPDAQLRAHRFDAQLIRHQLHTQGIVEMALVRRGGWCEAWCARALVRRYSLLAPRSAPTHSSSAPSSPAGAVAQARALLRDLPIPSAEFAFGRTKVFIRSPRTVWELEALRSARVSALVALAQRAWRRHRARRRRQERVHAQRVIARAWRTYRDRAGAERLGLRRRLAARRRVAALGVGASTWAAGVIWSVWCTCTRRRYLLTLSRRLPARHASPVCALWPPCPQPALLARTDALIRRLHHRWRCHRYRMAFDQTARNRMREKVTCSVLFRERKITYARSVAHPFVGDYVRLRASAAWRRGPGGAADRYVVFADVVRKVARAGRGGRVLGVVSTHALLLLDARSLRVKRRVPAHSVYRLSLSPHADDLLVVHVRACGALESSTEELSQCSSRDAADAAGCLFGESRRRGDVVLRAVHVLELATKLFLVVQNACGAPPHVAISPQFECSLGGTAVTVTVHAGGGGGSQRLVRRGSRLDVLL